jgi:hypothetical protein
LRRQVFGIVIFDKSVATVSFEIIIVASSSIGKARIMASNSSIAFPPLPLIRAVIFDLDGTLLDTETESTLAINLVLAQYDTAITADIKRAIIGMRSSEWSSYIISVLSLEGKIDSLELVRQWEENLAARMSAVALMPGAMEAITFFKKLSIPMAIATSSSPASVAAKRAAHPDVRNLQYPHSLLLSAYSSQFPFPSLFPPRFLATWLTCSHLRMFLMENPPRTYF